MNNERVTFFKKTSEEIENLPIKSGQIIFDITNNKLYLDKNDEDRIQIEGLFDEDDLTKLNGIESGAQVNLIETIKMNGTALTISNKSVNITSVPASILTGAIKNGVTATTQAQTDNSTKVATTAYVRTAVDTAASNLQDQINAMPTAMVFRGTVGDSGATKTWAQIGNPSENNEGDTYKVISAKTKVDFPTLTENVQVGDTIISNSVNWVVIPSGDEPKGTVTSIATGIGLTGGPITTTGTISHVTSTVRPDSYGDNANQTPDYGETFKVPYFVVNDTGHITTASEHTVTLPDITSYFGTCDTAAGTPEKTVICSNFSLTDGARIDISFTNNNTTTTPQLNVNNTGAKSIYPAASYTWKAGEVVSFVYYNNQYHLVKGSLATTSYYGITKLSSSTSSTSTSLAATPSAVKAAYDLANTANTAAGTNATAISTILDGTTIDSFADVETALNNKQNNLVSGTNIKTVNSNSLLGSGNITVQPTLVSGTNIKTINNTSLLGSGNIDVATIANIPTKISDLTNDSDFLEPEDLDGYVAKQYRDATAYTLINPGIKYLEFITAKGSGYAQITMNEGTVSISANQGTTIQNVVNPTNNNDAANKLYVDNQVATKQDTLVASGTDQNIKTINGVSLLGSGDITISTGGTITIDDQLSSTSENPVQNKVINNALANKVNAESGKGLSTNDYTTTEKNKLSGIATGAQVNVIETIKVNNTALTPSSKAVNITVPTKVSQLTNDSGFISSYTETDPVYSASVAAGITSSDITNWNNKTSNTGTITGVSVNGTSVATSGVANIPAASTSAYGVTQLSSSTSSTSTTLAATPSAVKSAYDRASTAINNASTNATAISNIKDGTNLDSFGDVESALANKADSSSVTSQITALSNEIYSNCELVSNKSTSISSSSTNTQYPTALAVYNYTPKTFSGSAEPTAITGKDGDIYIMI